MTKENEFIDERKNLSHLSLKIVLSIFVAFLLGMELLLVPIAGTILLMRYGRSPIKSSYITLSILLSFLLMLSIGLAMFREGDYSRSLSSFYSVYILISGTLISAGTIKFLKYRHIKRNIHSSFNEYTLEAFGIFSTKTIFFFFSLLIFGLIYFSVMKQYYLEIPTLLHPLFGKSNVESLRYLSITRIFRADWGFGGFAVPRFIYFARWDTAGAIVVAICGNVAAARYYMKGNMKMFLLIEVISLMLIISTLTRTVTAIYFCFTIILLFWISKKKILVFSTYVCGGALIIFLSSSVYDPANLASFRSYSTNDRFDLYFAAMDVIAEQNPLFGTGYKPKDTSEYQYAIGSHSMVLSYLVRGGLLAASVAIITFWMLPNVLLLKGFSSRDPFIKSMTPFLFRGVMVTCAWTIFQEIDTSVVTFSFILFYLTIMGIWLRKKGNPAPEFPLGPNSR